MHFVKSCLSFTLIGVAASVLAFGAPDDSTLPPHRDSVVLLKFRSGISASQQSAILSLVGASVVKHIGQDVNVLNVGNGRVALALQVLKAIGAVLYIEPDYQTTPLDAVEGPTGPAPTRHVQTMSTLAVASGTQASQNSVSGASPNDTYFGQQWAILNTGQTVNGYTGIAGDDERALPAWSVTTGTNSVVVAVLDAGVQYSHPDLLTNMWNNPGGIGGCPAGSHGYNVLTGTCDPMDDEAYYGGHGTHVAGILGAVGNDAAGVAGVNWTTSIMPIKWVDGNTGLGYTSDLITAMDWVIKAKQAGVNVRVVNDSQTWAGTAFSQALSDEIDLLTANDILFVTAAGNTAENNDTTPRYPCSYNRPGMICVAASDEWDGLWSRSNYGATTVQLAAPGTDIYSTKRLSNYGFITGTSMASPQVAGTAALILSRGYLNVSDLKATILNNVDVLSSLTAYVSTGGRLNVCKAVPGCSSAAMATPVNSTPPSVTGLPQFGSVVGASAGTWSGAPSQYTYQWYRCNSSGSNCSPISGATSQTYGVLSSADTGSTLAVAVTGANTISSATAKSAVSGVILAASSPHSLNSTILDGQTLSGTVNWQANPAQSMNFVQFYIDGVLQQTVTASPYTYNQGSTGTLDTSTLSNGAHVLGLRALESDNRTYSFYGANVTVNNTGVSSPPANTALPTITGNAVVGQTLATSNGSWNNNPTSYSYQWNRCSSSGSGCSAISGATGASYIVSSADVGLTLQSSVTATNSSGSTSAVSAPTAVVTAGRGGSIALLQSNSTSGSRVGSVSAAFPSGNTAGNLIIAFVRMSTTTQTVTLTDSNGNTYQDAVMQTQNTDGHQIHIFFAKDIAAGPNTVTATFSSTNNYPFLAVYEYSGLSTTNPLDQTASAQGSSSSASSGATPVTTAPNELVFAGAGFASSFSGTAAPASGYTLGQQDTTPSTPRAVNETKTLSATGSVTGSFSLSSSTNWSAAVATFKLAGTVSSPTITTTSLPNGQQNTAYTTTLAASGGTTPYQWSITSGTLPPGLSLGASNGTISGTPTGTGTSTFTIQVKDANAQTASKSLSITVVTAGGGGSIALLQSSSVAGSRVGSVSAAFPSGNTAGNLIIAFVRMSTTTQTVTLTDSNGNTYQDAVMQTQTADGHQIHIFFAKNIAAGPDTVTAAFSSTNNYPFLAVYEYSGLSTTNPLDQTASAQGSSSSASSGATPVTTAPNELVFAGAGFASSFSGTAAAASGYTLGQQDTTPSTPRAVNETKTLSTTGSITGSFSLSSSTNWSAAVATFKP